MKKLLEDILFTGLGTLMITKEKAEELVDKMVKQGEVSRKEGREVLEKFKKKTEDSKDKLSDRVSQEVEERLDKMGIVTKDEVQEIRLQVNRLERELQALKEENGVEDKEENEEE